MYIISMGRLYSFLMRSQNLSFNLSLLIIGFNNRVILQLQTTHRKMNIIQIYAPTNDKTEAEIEEFYTILDEAMKLTMKGKITMGTFNSKLGRGAEGEYVGAFRLEERNSRGDRLLQFSTENCLFAANTFFKQHNRRLYSWKSPMDNEGRIIRNQIDFICWG